MIDKPDQREPSKNSFTSHDRQTKQRNPHIDGRLCLSLLIKSLLLGNISRQYHYPSFTMWYSKRPIIDQFWQHLLHILFNIHL